jgi:hypothetical protein
MIPSGTQRWQWKITIEFDDFLGYKPPLSSGMFPYFPMFPIIFPSKTVFPYAPCMVYLYLFITFQGRWWQTFQYHGASGFLGLSRWITLWEFNIAIENCPFSSLIYLLKMVIFHFAILVYQKVPKDTIIFRHQGLNGFFFR